MNRRTFIERSIAGAAGAWAAQLALPMHGDESPKVRSRVRIVQIGTKHGHAAGKLATLRALTDEFEVVGLCEPDDDRRSEVDGHPKFGGLEWLDERQALADPSVAAVAVETLVADLVPTAQRCVAAGKHVLLDKPAGDSQRAFAQLLATAAERKRVVQLGYMFRYNPAVEFCRDAVKQGLIGQVWAIDGVIGKYGDAETRAESERFAGGVMFELGCHLIDAIVGLLGAPRAVHAYGRKSQSGARTPDQQLAVLEYPGAVATVRASLTDVAGGERRQLVVCGTEGTIDIRPLEPPTMRLAMQRGRGSWRPGWQDVPLPDAGGRYDAELRHFAARVRGDVAVDTRDHDLAVHDCVLRAAGMTSD